MKSFYDVFGISRNPSVSATHCQLLLSVPFCHFVTFPHSMGNHPFQGSHIFLYLFVLADTFCYLLFRFCRDRLCRVRRFHTTKRCSFIFVPCFINLHTSNQRVLGNHRRFPHSVHSKIILKNPLQDIVKYSIIKIRFFLGMRQVFVQLCRRPAHAPSGK